MLALVLLVGLPITCAVLPLRTLTHVRLSAPFPAGSARLELELVREDGKVIHRQPLDPRGGSVFSYGPVTELRASRPGCTPRTFPLDGCTESFRFTDYHRYFHHGSASRYDRTCEIAIALECR